MVAITIEIKVKIAKYNLNLEIQYLKELIE
jgi:hypothetical protein